MIFVNFKSSTLGTGERALELAKKLAVVQKKIKIPIVLAPHDLDVYAIREIWEGEIWIQHVDYDHGTGLNPAESVKKWKWGVDGTFLNHSEHRFAGWSLLSRVVAECNEYELKNMVFADGMNSINEILKLKMQPTFLAYEPPELIASENTSVARAKPQIISEAVKATKGANIPLVVGAGVKDVDDVKKSLELGAVGVVLSSAILRSEDPESFILKLASGFGENQK